MEHSNAFDKVPPLVFVSKLPVLCNERHGKKQKQSHAISPASRPSPIIETSTSANIIYGTFQISTQNLTCQDLHVIQHPDGLGYDNHRDLDHILAHDSLLHHVNHGSHHK